MPTVNNIYLLENMAVKQLSDFAQSPSSIIPPALVATMQKYFRASGCACKDEESQRGRCEIAARGVLVRTIHLLHHDQVKKAEDAVMTIARINGM